MAEILTSYYGYFRPLFLIEHIIGKALVYRWLYFFALVGLVPRAFGIELSSETLRFDMRAVTMNFAHIDNHKDLSSTNSAMVNDDLGYLWVGTQDGLVRLDGYESKRFAAASKSENSLVSNYISSLAFEAKNRRLWIATANGLSAYNLEQQKFSNYQHDNLAEGSLSDNVVQSVFVDSAGQIWIGTKYGLNRYLPEKDSFELFFHDPNNTKTLTHNNILDIKEDGQGRIWIATQGGLNRYLGDGTFHRVQPFKSDDGSSVLITKIATDKNHNLWLGTESQGLVYFDSASEHISFVSNREGNHSLPSSYIRSLLFDENDELWIGTSSGLSFYNPMLKSFSTITNNVELSGNIIELFQDQTGVVWVGTWSRGLHRYNPGESHIGRLDLQTLRSEGQTLRKMADGFEQDFWFSTVKHLYKIDTSMQRIKRFDISSLNQSDSRPIPFVDTSRQRVYLMTDHIYDITDTKNLVKTALPNEIQNARWYSATLDWQGRLWLGSRNTGIYVLSPDFKTIVHHFQSAIAGYVRQINDRTMLIGSLTATHWIDINTFERTMHFPENTRGMLNPNVTGYHVTENQETWLATSGGIHQLLEASNGQPFYRAWTTEDGLPTDVITGPVEDSQGNLWFSSTDGLIRFDPKTHEIGNFDSTLGASSNHYIGQYVKDDTGRIFFQGPNGISIVDENLIVEPNETYPIVLNELTIRGKRAPASLLKNTILKKSVEYTSAITLQPKDRSFSVGFTTTFMPRVNDVKYFYRLIGFDNEWLKTSEKNRQIKYTNLDPGKYQLELYSLSGSGKKSDIRSVNINVKPWFYETLWFRFLVSFCVILLFFLWYKIRMLKIKKAHQLLELKVEQRTQDVRTLAEIAKDICFLLDIHELLQQIYHHIQRSLDVSVLAIGIYEKDKKRIKFERSLEMGKEMPLHYRPMDPDTHLAAWCLYNNREVIMRSYEDRLKYIKHDSHQLVGQKMQTVIYLPIRSRTDEMLGCVTLQSLNENAYSDDDIEFIRTIANYTGIALDNALVHSELKRVSSTDFLTGLPNRRAFLESAKYQLKAIKRTDQIVTFAMADLDNFKNFNDDFGHDCGDFVLKKAAEILCSTFREGDLVARWGGEEFIVMLPNTDSSGAHTALEKARKKLAEAEFNFQGSSLRVTSTFGICEHTPANSLNETINRADTALYQGKENGRNCVELFKDSAT